MGRVQSFFLSSTHGVCALSSGSLLNDLQESLRHLLDAELLPHGQTSPLSQLPRPPRIEEQGFHCFGQRLGIVWLAEQTTACYSKEFWEDGMTRLHDRHTR